jgi:hypothetical protein
MRMPLDILLVSCLLAPACASGSGEGRDTFLSSGPEDGSDASETAGDGDGDPTGDGNGDGDGDGDGPALDVAGGDDGGAPEVCDGVDILFVIDSSASMYDEQVALGQAFPEFATAIVDTLPVGTNIHVGVTTMEMSPDGADSIQFPCDEPNPQYYATPDDQPSGVNGAQGRLYEVANGPAYFDVDTDAPAQEIQALSDWFVEAAMVGIDGSSEEMPLAGAGWAFDPVNDPTNAGFVRDEGAALVLFFVTDESDQTPIEAAPGLIDRIAAAKAGCGGLACVAAGGTVRESCLPQDALGTLLSALDPSRVHTEPLEYKVQTEPQFFVDALRDGLSQIVVDLCHAIPPAG